MNSGLEDILMTDLGTVETPLLARIAKLAAVRRLTAAGPRAATLLRAVCAAVSKRKAVIVLEGPTKKQMVKVLEIMIPVNEMSL